ncbi:hypothetical protein [Pectinatus haikarae]|uniref:Tfp pilus assembly protein PilN n=1 Tax=Pectinatus haikarae TaxID=349096 RepID=A0ABT9Y8M5_9FIRM|nr:hypothetical protein [Pectinatus haikarae]MDQ0204183.1 Tfp pilus assembly protein PilN [Pectinatus haikarae]
MKNKKIEKLLYSNHINVVSLAIMEDDIYLANIKLEDNLWKIKNIEHYISVNFSEFDQLSDILKNAVLKIGCRDLPVYMCISADKFNLYKNIFPPMSYKELKKAIYWEIRGNAAIDDTQCVSFDYEYTEDSVNIKIYTAEKAFIMTLYAICTAAYLCPCGVFPLQDEVLANKEESEIFQLGWHKGAISFHLPTDESILPPYIKSLAQNILLKDSKLDLLPEKQKPARLNWRIISVFMCAAAFIFTAAIASFFHFVIAAAHEEEIGLESQLHNMKNIVEQKNMFENYQMDIQKRKNILLGLHPINMSGYALLSNMGSVYIDGVWLNAVKTDETDNIIITGTSLSYEALEEYIEALKQYYFPDTSMLSEKEEKETGAVIFVLKIYKDR